MRNRLVHLATAIVTAFLVHCVALSSAASGPANAPAPMFGLNFANTGQSVEYGPTTAPSVIWQRSIGSNGPNPQSLALSADGLLYTPGGYALNSTDGSTAWRSPTGGRDTHPALDGDGRVFAFESGRMQARIASTGAPLWSANTNASAGEAPRIGPDGTIYASTFAGSMTAYTPTGQTKWSMHLGSVQYGEVSLIPAIDAENNIYLAGGNGLLSVGPSGNVRWTTNWTPSGSSRVMLAPNGNVIWQRDDLVEQRDPTTGALVSSFNTLSSLQASDSDGNLYFTNGYVGLTKTTLSGQLLWTFPRFGADHPVTVDAGGNVFFGDQNGNLIGLSSNGSKLWEVHVANSNPFPFLHSTAPVIGPNGQLFILSQSEQMVTALAVPEPSNLILLVATPAFLTIAKLRTRDRKS